MSQRKEKPSSSTTLKAKNILKVSTVTKTTSHLKNVQWKLIVGPLSKNTYNAPPQLPPSSGQNYISCQDRLVKAFDKKKTYFAKLSSRNTEYLCLRNKSIRDRVPRNINPALQADILEQSRSKADLPGDLRAALRDKCVELHLCFNLAPLDEKLCERLMQPAQSHEEAMIIDLKDISGYSFMGFVCRGMNYITANGQKVGKLISY